MKSDPTEIKSGPPDVTDVLDIGVRAYAVPENKKKEFVWEFPSRGPSRWHLIFDTETTTDETQRLRIGTYQLREGEVLRESGIFFDSAALSRAEINLLRRFGTDRRLKVITVREFIDTVFIPAVQYWKATVVGFNLPFDLSRLAEGHADARGNMRPGLSFSVVPKGRSGPRIRIKHLSRRASLFELSGAGQRLPRGQRKRKVTVPSRWPAFIDVSTIAAALLSRSFSLGELARHLNTPNQKLGVDEHGAALTAEYLDYAVRDVQVTWECFVELSRRYAEHGLTKTPLRRILSEASLGKGYLREMGIKPWREMQPDFPPELIGKIMGTYYGGRTEVHWRRVIKRVLYCDFTSMYPTVSTLMGLWRFVIAKGMSWRDATDETRRFLETVTLADLQRPETWRWLHVIVQVAPEGDILPVRAKYEAEPGLKRQPDRHYTIGLNRLSSEEPLWYTLADAIASKLLTGRAPRILQAIAVKPGEPQEKLAPVTIAGKPEFKVDPLNEDFFKRIIELRMQTKGPERNALKLVANSTGYGIFVQLDVNELSKPVAVRCYPASGRDFVVEMDKVEEPGEFFHPLLGTLITGAARLMLAITERIIADAGLTWTFCDTDSMAIAQPEGMSDAEFLEKAEAVRSWFKPLNPYAVDVDLFKLEDANFKVVDGKVTAALEPLYCLAISSKRYVLFNVDDQGRPVIRKASAHGLGHLVAPYNEKDAPAEIPAPLVILDENGVDVGLAKIGVSRWQYDFWYCIALAAFEGHPDTPDYSCLPNFDLPAVSRYAITTANLAQWFDPHNQGKPYVEQVRPFNFMNRLLADPMADWESWRATNGLDFDQANPNLPCVIAPFSRDISKVAETCFDRDTGAPVPAHMLKTYRQALQTYHRSPEAKFLDAGYLDKGFVRRRHVKAANVVNIGKEAHRWEEQSALGIDREAEIAYGKDSDDRSDQIVTIREAISKFGPMAVQKETGLTRQYLHSIARRKASPSATVLGRLIRAAQRLERAEAVHRAEVDAVLAAVTERCRKIGRAVFAASAKISTTQLSRVLNHKRPVTGVILSKLRRTLMRADKRTQTS